jgi:hypothetical protein
MGVEHCTSGSNLLKANSDSRSGKALKECPKTVLHLFHTVEFKFYFVARQPLVGKGPVIIGASRLHSDTPHSVGLLLTSDQPDAETST